MTRLFPYEFESRKEILFYPSKPEIFSGDILEIGPGRGDWLLNQATAHPDKKFVAVEMGQLRYAKLVSRIEKAELKNILLIQGDVRLVLPQFFAGDTFEKIFVMFPDPWPRERHYFRRLLQIEFLALLCHVMKNGGSFLLATDAGRYADWARENIKAIPELSEVAVSSQTPFPEYSLASSILNANNSPTGLADTGQVYKNKFVDCPVTTFFEKKWREMGRSIHYLKAIRKSESLLK